MRNVARYQIQPDGTSEKEFFFLSNLSLISNLQSNVLLLIFAICDVYNMCIADIHPCYTLYVCLLPFQYVAETCIKCSGLNIYCTLSFHKFIIY